MKRICLSIFSIVMMCTLVFTPVSAMSTDMRTVEISSSLSGDENTISDVSQEEMEILDSGKCGENLFWELDSNGLLRIFGEGPMYDYNKYFEPSPWYKYRDEPYISDDGASILDKDGSIYLPSTDYFQNNPNGYKIGSIIIEDGVTYIGDWAFYRVCVEEITVPETVTATGIFCFRYSPTLKVLNLPDSLKVLDDYAISRNYELETINMGNSLETVGVAGFNNNPSLKELVLPDTCTTINKQLSPAYASIDYSKVGLLENCSSLAYVDFGKVTKIPQRTCLGTSIETAVIPNTVESIDDYAFYMCSSLKNVVFEEGSICKTIKSSAFFSCTSLESVKGGISLETLGVYTSISTLKDFDFSTTNKAFEKKQFEGTSLKEVKVSDNISVIPVSCFNGMQSLEKIYLPSTITNIQASSFNYCYSLKDVYYDGTLAQWLSVQKASGWSYKVNSECMLHLADGTSVSLWYKPAACTVTFVDYDGTELSTQSVEYGASATPPEDPTREGYIFTGWDQTFTTITSDLTVTATYEENEEETDPVTPATGSLKIELAGGVTFRISIDGSASRLQGASYNNSCTPVGAQVTVEANATSFSEFIAWVNIYDGKILSEEMTYSFYASGNDYIKAMYSIDDENFNMVTFYNDKAKQQIDVQYYNAEDSITSPYTDPVAAGWIFKGWSMSEEQIQAEIAKGNDVTVTPVWEKELTYVNVTVNGGTAAGTTNDAGQFLANNAVTVTADTAPTGKKFAYWTDASGNIKSFETTYKLFPASDTTLTAVFVDEGTEIDYKVLVSVDTFVAGTYGQFNTSWYVPTEQNGYTFVGTGLIAVNSTKYNESTFVHGTTDSNVFDKSSTSTESSGTYIWTGPVYSGETWYCKAWVQYKDAQGKVQTVYTDMFTAVKE